MDEPLALFLALQRVGTNRAVGHFDESDYGDGDIKISRSSGDSREHLPHVLPLTLGCDQHTGIDD